MHRPVIAIQDVIAARGAWARSNLLPFVAQNAELMSTRDVRSRRQPDILILSDPESAVDESFAVRVPVVKLRYTLTRRAWQTVASIPWRATVTASPNNVGMLSLLRSALDHLQRSDIRFAPGQEGPATLYAGEFGRFRLEARNDPRVGHEIDVPLVAPGNIIELLRLLGQLDGASHLAVCNYLRRVAALPKDTETLLDVVSEARECLHQVSRMSGQALIEVDRHGAVIHASGPVEVILSRHRTELFGQSIHKTCPELAAMITASLCGERQISINGHALGVRVAPITGHASRPGGWVLALSPRGETSSVPKPQFASNECAEDPAYHFTNIIGSSPPIDRARRLALRAGRSDSAVLIIGESGTGKELMAQAMHNISSRAGGPFIAINCAAIPETLIETELFGYEGGAFTGAQRRGRPGLFERAHSGTLFLDEVSDMSPHLQATLLRVLEGGAVRRVGGSRDIPVRVRVIAAANRPLEELVREGGFRRDLYHRLCVIPLRLPSLRERRQDIALLARYFLEKLSDSRALPDEVLDYFGRYRWPGNVRELQHCIEYMVTMAEGPFTVADLPPHIQPYVEINSAPYEPEAIAADTANPQVEIVQLESLCSSLVDEGCRVILSLIANANYTGVPIGRRSLRVKVCQKGLALTERAVRTRLRALRTDGLVEWGLGRSGVRVSPKGRSAHRQLGSS